MLPAIMVAVAGILLAVMTCVWVGRTQMGWLMRTVVLLLSLVLLLPAAFFCRVFHPEWVDGRFRTYKAFYQDIEIGMTREQVEAALAKRYPVKGVRQRPTIWEDKSAFLGFFMNPEGSTEPNCEGIFLTVDNGRVSKKEYSAD